MTDAAEAAAAAADAGWDQQENAWSEDWTGNEGWVEGAEQNAEQNAAYSAEQAGGIAGGSIEEASSGFPPTTENTAEEQVIPPQPPKLGIVGKGSGKGLGGPGSGRLSGPGFGRLGGPGLGGLSLGAGGLSLAPVKPGQIKPIAGVGATQMRAGSQLGSSLGGQPGLSSLGRSINILGQNTNGLARNTTSTLGVVKTAVVPRSSIPGAVPPRGTSPGQKKNGQKKGEKGENRKRDSAAAGANSFGFSALESKIQRTSTAENDAKRRKTGSSVSELQKTGPLNTTPNDDAGAAQMMKGRVSSSASGSASENVGLRLTSSQLKHLNRTSSTEKRDYKEKVRY
jgi:hypothetical protein